MTSLSLLKQRLKTEADAALSKAAEAQGPVEKREWLDVVARAMETYERICETQRMPHA